jgi:hypothetical protein
MDFEINIPPLTGAITKAELFEVGGVTPPTNVISFAQAFGVHMEWQLCGFLAPYLPGNWRVVLLMEKMGPGGEPDVPPGGQTVALSAHVPCATAPGCICWTHDLNVTAGAVPAGTYHVVVSLTWEPATGTPGPMAGFADLGMLQIYQ